MDFFQSLSVIFRIWQVFCLSPFSLKNNNQRETVSAPIFKIFSVTMITFQALVIILSLTFVRYILYDGSNQIIRTFDVITMSLAQLTALVIFSDSYQQRYTQMEILRKMNSIDFILKFKIGVTTDYTVRRKTNINRMLRTMILNVSVFIVNLLVMKTDVYLWWIILYPSFFICSLRYLQIITYVDIVHHRCIQINRFINNCQKSKGKRESFFDFTKIETVFTLTQKCKSKCIEEKITDLRRVFRLMASVNRSLNQIFKWSIPLIIVNDFLHIMVNSYWFLVILLFQADSLIYLIGLFAWTSINAYHLLSLSSACQHAVQEVSFNVQ